MLIHNDTPTHLSIAIELEWYTYQKQATLYWGIQYYHKDLTSTIFIGEPQWRGAGKNTKPLIYLISFPINSWHEFVPCLRVSSYMVTLSAYNIRDGDAWIPGSNNIIYLCQVWRLRFPLFLLCLSQPLTSMFLQLSWLLSADRKQCTLNWARFTCFFCCS